MPYKGPNARSPRDSPCDIYGASKATSPVRGGTQWADMPLPPGLWFCGMRTTGPSAIQTSRLCVSILRRSIPSADSTRPARSRCKAPDRLLWISCLYIRGRNGLQLPNWTPIEPNLDLPIIRSATPAFTVRAGCPHSPRRRPDSITHVATDRCSTRTLRAMIRTFFGRR